MAFYDDKSPGDTILSQDWDDFVDFTELISSNAAWYSSDYIIFSGNSSGYQVINSKTGYAVYTDTTKFGAYDAIDYAIDQLSNGGVIHLTAKNNTRTLFPIDADLRILSNITLQGEGINTVIVTSGGAVYIKNDSDVVLDNFYVSGLHGIEVNCTTICENITFKDINVHAISSSYAAGYGKDAGFELMSQTTGDVIKNVKFLNCTADRCGKHGFYFTSNDWTSAGVIDGILLDGCRAIKCGMQGTWGTGIDYQEQAHIKNELITNCYVSGCLESGFHGEDNPQRENIVITNCISEYNGQKYNSTGKWQGTLAQYGRGYAVCSGVTLMNSVARGNRHGIRMNNSSKVIGCTIIGDPTLGSMWVDSGIVTEYFGTYEINGNSIHNVSAQSILLNASEEADKGSVVANNIITSENTTNGAKSIGIRVNKAPQTIIVNNSVKERNTGIMIDSTSPGCLVEGNFVSGNNTDFSDSATGTVVRNNINIPDSSWSFISSQIISGGKFYNKGSTADFYASAGITISGGATNLGTLKPHILELKGNPRGDGLHMTVNDPRIIIRNITTNQPSSGRLMLLEGTTDTYGADMRYDGDTNKFHIRTLNDTDKIDAITVARNTGFVGINNTSPAYNLQVGGTIYTAYAVSAQRFRFGNRLSGYQGSIEEVRFDPIGHLSFISTQTRMQRTLEPTLEIKRYGTLDYNLGGLWLTRTDETAGAVISGGFSIYFNQPNDADQRCRTGFIEGFLSNVTDGAEIGNIVLTPSYLSNDNYYAVGLKLKAVNNNDSEVYIPYRLRVGDDGHSGEGAPLFTIDASGGSIYANSISSQIISGGTIKSYTLSGTKGGGVYAHFVSANNSNITGAGGLNNVVEDTSPQLGGNLGGQSTYGISSLTYLSSQTISGGTITANSLDINSTSDYTTIQMLHVENNMKVAKLIEHYGDADTYINFMVDNIQLQAGGIVPLSVSTTGTWLSGQTISGGVIQSTDIRLPDSNTRLYTGGGDDLSITSDDDIILEPDGDLFIEHDDDGVRYARFVGGTHNVLFSPNIGSSLPWEQVSISGNLGISGNIIGHSGYLSSQSVYIRGNNDPKVILRNTSTNQPSSGRILFFEGTNNLYGSQIGFDGDKNEFFLRMINNGSIVNSYNIRRQTGYLGVANRLGIGTTKPPVHLTVSGQARIIDDTAPVAEVRRVVNGAGVYETMIMGRKPASGSPPDGFGAGMYFKLEGGGGNYNYAGLIGSKWVDATPTSSMALVFSAVDNGTDPYDQSPRNMTIHSDGYIGILDDTPSYELDVNGSIYAATVVSSQLMHLTPHQTEPSKVAGTLWASGNTTHAPLYYCSSNNGQWKQIAFV